MHQEITIAGALGGDPELRYTNDGTPYCNFSLATNRRWTSKDGTQQQETLWFRITAWQKTAELAAQYLTKGQKALIVGEMQKPRVWQARDGEHRCELEVRAQKVRFMTSKAEANQNYPAGTGQTTAPGAQNAGNAQNTGAAQNDPYAGQEDIPF